MNSTINNSGFEIKTERVMCSNSVLTPPDVTKIEVSRSTLELWLSSVELVLGSSIDTLSDTTRSMLDSLACSMEMAKLK
jgi:hypothetical protein